MQLQFDVNKQIIKRTDKENPVENSSEYLYAKFTFTSDWNDVRKINVFFTTDGTNWFVVQNMKNGICEVPQEVIKFPSFMLYLVGFNDENLKVITTNICRSVFVAKTGTQQGELTRINRIISETLDVVQDGNTVYLEIPDEYITNEKLRVELEKKLDKVNNLTDKDQVYTKSKDGSQTMTDIDNEATQNSLAKRDENGNIKIGDATKDNDALNRKVADDRYLSKNAPFSLLSSDNLKELLNIQDNLFSLYVKAIFKDYVDIEKEPTTDKNPIPLKYFNEKMKLKADLGENGKVLPSQLPESVYDVIEGYYYNGEFYLDSSHTQKITPKQSKLYIDKATNLQYLWTGTQYTILSPQIALGETVGTAYEGIKGKKNADAIKTINEQLNKTKETTPIPYDELSFATGNDVDWASDSQTTSPKSINDRIANFLGYHIASAIPENKILQDSYAYNLEVVATTIEFELPTDADETYTSELSFTTGDVLISMSYSIDITWTGEDVSNDNTFIPDTNKHYNIIFWKDKAGFQAVVRGY